MPILTVGSIQKPGRFRFATTDGPVDTGTATCYYQTEDDQGNIVYLQADRITLDTTKHIFAGLVYNAQDETWDDLSFGIPDSLKERAVDAVGEHSDFDGLQLPRAVQSWYVQGASTDDIFEVLTGTTTPYKLGFPEATG